MIQCDRTENFLCSPVTTSYCPSVGLIVSHWHNWFGVIIQHQLHRRRGSASQAWVLAPVNQWLTPSIEAWTKAEWSDSVRSSSATKSKWQLSHTLLLHSTPLFTALNKHASTFFAASHLSLCLCAVCGSEHAFPAFCNVLTVKWLEVGLLIVDVW